MNIKQIRKELHQIPELGRREFKTKAYLCSFAETLSCTVLTPTETGVAFYFDAHQKTTLCFRADMDALPIAEQTNLPFASSHQGIMHACAHDGHMAMLLGFAQWANDHIDQLKNNILCLFQPSEEENAGANDILKSGILEQYHVDRVFGMHIWPNLPENQVYTMPGGMLATSGEVDINVHGTAMHAANRTNKGDALLASAKIITEFYEKMALLKEPHLISFGKIVSGTARNAVAQEAHLQATMRAFDDPVFLFMKNELQSLLKKIELEWGVQTELFINAAYPSVLNDPALVLEYQSVLNYTLLDKPFLQAEDFGCYTRKYPSLFLLLGCGSAHLLHTSRFDFNMDILDTGVKIYQKIACKAITK